MTEVIFLGTGTPSPDADRAGSGVAVIGAGGWILVDCGRGVTQRALQASLDLTTVSAVCLTHHHSDHISDLATFATTRWTAGGVGPLIVVAPDGPCARFAELCLDAFEDQAFHSQAAPSSGPRPTIGLLAFEADTGPAAVFEEDGWKVSSALVEHQPIEAAVAYSIVTGDHTVVVSGDTAACSAVRRLAQDADLLIHEALLSDQVPPELLEWNAGAATVGALAAASRVKSLVLTHLLPAPTAPAEEQAFVDEARGGGYNGPLAVARDLMRIRLSLDPPT